MLSAVISLVAFIYNLTADESSDDVKSGFIYHGNATTGTDSLAFGGLTRK